MNRQFKECSKCKRCCNNPTKKNFNITLTEKEQNILKKQTILIKPNENCEYLTNKGCRLTKHRPIICKLFPLIIRSKKLYIDSSCILTHNTRQLNTIKEQVNNLNKEEIKQISKQRYVK